MDRKFLIGGALGAMLVTAGGVIAGFGLVDRQPSFAEVLQVSEIKRSVQIPREECEEVVVSRQAPPKDDKQILGTVTGAVVGGVLGNQIGSGSGKKIATIAGAAAGGYGGKKVQERIQQNNTQASVEQRCRTVTDSREELVGYDVRYRLGDREGTVRMDHHPGERIPVRDGELVLQEDGAAVSGQES